MVAERKIYEEEGVEKYVAHQVEHESEPLRPGAAFPFVKVGPSPETVDLLQGVVPEVRSLKHEAGISVSTACRVDSRD